MPLTRHFYALDEVQAAILYSGSRGIPKETVFWCHELVCSGHASEAIHYLFESWLWHRGPFHLAWFIEAMERLGGSEITEDDILWMAQQLSLCSVKDHSLTYLFAVSATDSSFLFDRVTCRPFPIPFPSDDPLEQFFIRAIHQHKAGAAWWAGLQLSISRWWELVTWYRESLKGGLKEGLKAFWDAVEAYDLLLGYRSDVYDAAMRGLALLVICMTEEQLAQSLLRGTKGYPIETWVTDWDAVLDRRAGRIFPIPHFGLYGITERGKKYQTESTVSELFDVRRGVQGCALWEERLEATDTASWYAQYFPDDLPDEWTTQEKEKSHGSGILQRTEEATLWGYLRRYLSGRCRLLWSFSSNILNRRLVSEKLERILLEESPFPTLLSLPIDMGPITDFTLRPVHKHKVVRG